jgi:transporter family protein
MSWITLSLLALILWAIVNILDKYVVDHELRDPIFVTAIFCLAASILLIGSSLLFGLQTVSVLVISLAMVTGLMYSLAIYLYYTVMRGEEVSRLVPFISIEPLFIALGAFLFFGEQLGWQHYLGILLVVSGAILIARERSSNKLEKLRLQHLHLLALLMVLLFSGKNLLVKYLFFGNDFWTIMFWFGLGGLILPILLFVFHHPRIRGKFRRGVEHLIVSAVFSSVALILFSQALKIGSVSLVIALIATKPMLVFLVATICSFIFPKIICEKHSLKILLLKVLATVMIVVGGILIIMR